VNQAPGEVIQAPVGVNQASDELIQEVHMSEPSPSSSVQLFPDDNVPMLPSELRIFALPHESR